MNKLVQKVIDKLAAKSAPLKSLTPASSQKTEQKQLFEPDKDLNKVPLEELTKIKAKMEEDFEKKKIKPGQPGFQYDKRVRVTFIILLI